MSRENIISIVVGEGEVVLVTFSLRNGETRTYSYAGSDAALLLMGADPAYLNGVQVG